MKWKKNIEQLGTKQLNNAYITVSVIHVVLGFFNSARKLQWEPHSSETDSSALNQCWISVFPHALRKQLHNISTWIRAFFEEINRKTTSNVYYIRKPRDLFIQKRKRLPIFPIVPYKTARISARVGSWTTLKLPGRIAWVCQKCKPQPCRCCRVVDL